MYPMTVAYAATAVAHARLLIALNEQITEMEKQVKTHFLAHPDAGIYLSMPGIAEITGARVLAEFGDDPTRYADTRARRNYAATSPITRASGTRRVVLARAAGNKRLRDALYLQAFAALSRSPGARAYYDTHRARGHTHHQALRALANRLVGILHGCLRHHTTYNETTAWTNQNTNHAAA
jgi:transposase